jgi:pyrimidine operon attenuation protein / uracil phosphoribosyltransferase
MKTIDPNIAELLYQQLRDQIAASLPARQVAPHLIGVHSGGAWIASRLHADLKLSTPLGFLSSAFHRDDFNQRGLPANSKPTELNFSIEAAQLIIVDDILYTGRTVRAVLNELYDYGRPAKIEMAVLIDRGGRELPVFAQYVGGHMTLPENQSYVLTQDTRGHFNLGVE